MTLVDLAAVIVRDIDGTIRFWSRGCDHLFGWAAADAVGQMSHALLHTVHPDSRVKVEDALGLAGKWTGDLKHYARACAEVDVLALKILRRDAAGQTLVLEILTDITPLRQPEAALRKSQANLQSVVETAAECIIGANSNGSILSINRAGLSMFGYEHETDLIGQDAGLLMPVTEAMRHGAYVAAHRAGAPPRIIGVPGRELYAARRDGSVFPID
jgi:PAS domain S-box-containing protein